MIDNPENPVDIPRMRAEDAPEKPEIAVQAPVVENKMAKLQRLLPLEAVIAPMCYKAEAGTTLEDVTNPHFWVSMAVRLQKNMEITVISDCGKLDCTLRVTGTGPSYAEVAVLRNGRDDVDVELTGVKPTWNIGYKNWDVSHNGKVVRTGFQTKEAAEQFSDDYRMKRRVDIGKPPVN